MIDFNKYNRIFTNTKYFGTSCVSTGDDGQFPFDAVISNNENKFDIADHTLIGKECWLTINTSDLITCNISSGRTIYIDRTNFIVREITKQQDLTTKLRLKIKSGN